jgi:hypothetical protein
MAYEIAMVEEAGEDGGACFSCCSEEENILIGHGLCGGELFWSVDYLFHKYAGLLSQFNLYLTKAGLYHGVYNGTFIKTYNLP